MVSEITSLHRTYAPYSEIWKKIKKIKKQGRKLRNDSKEHVPGRVEKYVVW
jgi:hypothetical protein